MTDIGFRLADLLMPKPPLIRADPPNITVIDVGALPLPGNKEIYSKLVDLDLCTVIGFEPAGDA